MDRGIRAIRAWALVAGLCAADSVEAGGIARCVGAHGEPMFAQRCSSAERVPGIAPARSGLPVARPGRSGIDGSGTCAHSPQQLADRVQAAIHARNGVRLSGYALWRGHSGRGVRNEVRALLQVLKSGVADVQLRRREDPPFAYSDGDIAAPRRGEHALVIASLSEQGGDLHSGERWFGVARDHGCYWLTLAPPAWLDEESPGGDVQADAAALAWDVR